MQGRFIHVEVERWTVDELRYIPDVGFPALNCKVQEDGIQKICTEALGNPLLVQDLCFRLCQYLDIQGTVPNELLIDVGSLEVICQSVAENSGFPILDRLARGPQARKDRKVRSLRGGGYVDIYQAILLSVVENGAKSETSYEELRTSLREILSVSAILYEVETKRDLEAAIWAVSISGYAAD